MESLQRRKLGLVNFDIDVHKYTQYLKKTNRSLNKSIQFLFSEALADKCPDGRKRPFAAVSFTNSSIVGNLNKEKVIYRILL